ncbi:MAG: hypothetical protein WBD31_14085 [Rubripirellula sp.]
MPAVADKPFYVGGLIRTAGAVTGNATGKAVAGREAKKLGKDKQTQHAELEMLGNE